MKTRLLLLIAATMFLTVAGGIKASAQTLVVNHADGKATHQLLGAINKITFGDGKVIISTRKGTNSYATADIKSLSYDYRQPDVNKDLTVDVADIAAVINVMATGNANPDLNADVNGDGVTDVADISTIISVMSSFTFDNQTRAF